MAQPTGKCVTDGTLFPLFVLKVKSFFILIKNISNFEKVGTFFLDSRPKKLIEISNLLFETIAYLSPLLFTTSLH